MAPPISVVVERGGVVEARHRVHAVSVRGGALVEAAGDPSLVAHMRSVAKPLQALALAVEIPEIPDDELAIACASHEALPEQLEAVRRLLARSGSTEEELECGDERRSRLAHNCSGKHAGMLLRTKRRGWPLPGYRLADHPLQRDVLATVAEATVLPAGDVLTAVDGCGVQTFAVPLEATARAFSRLAAADLPGAERVADAMRAHPALVGGPTAADTVLMGAVEGAVAKRGAEGFLCLALADGTGVALKVEDGAGRAALAAAARFLGVEPLEESPVFNSRGERVGRVFPAH